MGALSGIGNGWCNSMYRGPAAHRPAVLAGPLIRLFLRRRDDRSIDPQQHEIPRAKTLAHPNISYVLTCVDGGSRCGEFGLPGSCGTADCFQSSV